MVEGVGSGTLREVRKRIMVRLARNCCMFRCDSGPTCTFRTSDIRVLIVLGCSCSTCGAVCGWMKVDIEMEKYGRQRVAGNNILF